MPGNKDALARMANDADMAAERLGGLALAPAPVAAAAAAAAAAAVAAPYVPLNRTAGVGHRPNAATVALFNQVGPELVREMTESFYQKSFADPHIDSFIREHSDPHGTRFASWVQEKFGVGTPWSDERSSRKTCPFSAHGHTLETPHDRSSAHFAAWHSPKRPVEKFGNHFKLDDCRNWMRLHFWAMREVGIPEKAPGFADYYVRYIGHFVSVYERSAPRFASESFRWSADPANIVNYKARGNRMEASMFGASLERARQDLTAAERANQAYPYEPDLDGALFR